MDDEERAEAQRKRHRALAIQVKRALLTLASGVQQWLNDDPEEPSYPDVIPGDSQTLPKPTSRPPAQYR